MHVRMTNDEAVALNKGLDVLIDAIFYEATNMSEQEAATLQVVQHKVSAHLEFENAERRLSDLQQRPASPRYDANQEEIR